MRQSCWHYGGFACWANIRSTNTWTLCFSIFEHSLIVKTGKKLRNAFWLPFTLYFLLFFYLFSIIAFFESQILAELMLFFLCPGRRTYNLYMIPAGLPGCHGGRVLRRRGGRALPLPLLLPGILCLHHHAVCHPPGLETDRLQVSERPAFSRPAFSNCFGEKKCQSGARLFIDLSRFLLLVPVPVFWAGFFLFFSCQSP